MAQPRTKYFARSVDALSMGALEGGALGGGGGGALSALRTAGSPPAPSLGASRHSLIEMMTCRLGSRRLGGSRGSLQTGPGCTAASELDLSTRSRRAHKARLKLLGASEAPLLSGWRSTPHTPHAPATPAPHHSHNHLAPSHCNGTDSGSRALRRRSTYASGRLRSGPHWSFVFDPAGRLCYYWSMVVSLAFLYNLWVIVYRFAFSEINGETLIVWFCLDYFSDFLYLADILFHFRTGYLEDGVLQTDAAKLRAHYMNSTTFYIDCLCLLPLDFLYLSIGFNSILRSFRLVKIYRFWAFMDRTERHTNYPNLFRSTSLIHYLLVIFHWNGCLYHIIYKNNGFGSKNWVYHDTETADVVKQYLQSYYWCTLALTTIGDLPRPRSKGEYVFVIAQLLFGLLMFATVLGHVANIVTSVSTARKEFQAKLDGVKTYMRMRRVPNHLQVKVIKWFDYLWLTQKCSDEEKAVSCLPDKLKAEIAINVHLDTLKRVEIFQNTEAGFLCELVLRLRPVLFSPGDYICRKGEVGKEMYIVNRGKLQVVGDNGKTVLATLKAGSYFGEISILNMGTAGKQLEVELHASVRSVGYSDLFVLSKKDMWDVLKEYPAARVRLEAIAVKRLEKYKKAPLEKVAMGRCQSTPGLVETSGRIPIEDMQLQPASVIPMHPSHPPSYRDQLYSSSVSPLRVASPVASLASSARSSAAGGGSIAAVSIPPRVMLESHDALECEIKRLRERLYTVETENAAMSAKLSQQQWEVDQRLQEIEMQICGGSSVSSQEDNERNRESII
ncbi:cyclic nucleotide-gated cation channel alpha-3 isoform X5 [Plodia interpunctella]|uniref:cyclic nucleotide-gated cation channel alpha-3 isoform X5 n=1 Tax=Plodia interpunctella TaxID=58824 RepID=UPI002368500D|nr:cyclic nucleotide-gated cation channel alpha-3 isoform X5 [Plodia interpunctella]